jgi:endogenous inhibitor of DNA gyrase (YacG/DUF329 family)
MISPCVCPICGKPLSPAAAEESAVFPFCSVRCKQVDLYRWSEGKYAIVEPVSPEDLPQAPPEELDDSES